MIARLENLRGQPVPLGVLKQVREQIGSAAGSNEPQVRRIAGQLLNGIDGFVTHVDPAQSQLPPGQVGPMWQEARRLWRTAATIDDVGYAMSKAERRAASTNSGQNTENAIRQNIRGVVDKAEKPRRYNPTATPSSRRPTASSKARRGRTRCAGQAISWQVSRASR